MSSDASQPLYVSFPADQLSIVAIDVQSTSILDISGFWVSETRTGSQTDRKWLPLGPGVTVTVKSHDIEVFVPNVSGACGFPWKSGTNRARSAL